VLIHVLSPGFETPNGRAFLFPLVVWREALAARGMSLRFFRSVSSKLLDCDVLLVDSKFHRDRWRNGSGAVLAEFSHFAEHCRVVYCDTTDSSGWIQTDLLPHVHVYAKAQLLNDRGAYMKTMYAHRPYTDYYHRTLGVEDAQPEWSIPVTNPRLLDKLRVSWNSGLADYSLHGPARMALFYRLPIPFVLRFSRAFTDVSAARSRDISSRFGTNYPRASVSIQRRLIRERLGNRIGTTKLSRRAYFNELQTSKVAVSPFGYGEITLKDFEVFLTGGLLVKPDMSHMTTWPNLFRADETMLVHSWDLSDFEATLERAVGDYARLMDVAQTGQESYRAYTVAPDAADRFSVHLRAMVAETH
jgi:hypothetical protein